jgi:hypothetical protein
MTILASIVLAVTFYLTALFVAERYGMLALPAAVLLGSAVASLVG